jgi:hypothetical protein
MVCDNGVEMKKFSPCALSFSRCGNSNWSICATLNYFSLPVPICRISPKRAFSRILWRSKLAPTSPCPHLSTSLACSVMWSTFWPIVKSKTIVECCESLSYWLLSFYQLNLSCKCGVMYILWISNFWFHQVDSELQWLNSFFIFATVCGWKLHWEDKIVGNAFENVFLNPLFPSIS